MEQTNRHLEFAFQKLFQWTQKHLKTPQHDSPEANALARKAIRTLAERPALFQYRPLKEILTQKMLRYFCRHPAKDCPSGFFRSP